MTFSRFVTSCMKVEYSWSIECCHNSCELSKTSSPCWTSRIYRADFLGTTWKCRSATCGSFLSVLNAFLQKRWKRCHFILGRVITHMILLCRSAAVYHRIGERNIWRYMCSDWYKFHFSAQYIFHELHNSSFLKEVRNPSFCVSPTSMPSGTQNFSHTNIHANIRHDE